MAAIEMKNDTDVLAHIRKRNAETERRAQEEGWSFYTLFPEALASRFETVYEFELEMAKQTYSDAYKEKVGIRPSLNPEWTLEDVWAKIDRL